MFPRIVFVIGLAVILAMAEVQRLAGELLSRVNHPFHLGDVTGPTAFAHLDNWNDWKGIVGAESPAGLIWTHIGLDVVFMASYCLLTAVVIGKYIVPAAGSPIVNVLRELRRKGYLTALLVVLLVVDAVEDTVLGFAAAHMGAGSAPDYAIPLAAASTLKWLLTFWLYVSILTAPEVRRRLGGWFTQARYAMRAHRLATAVVVILIVLSLLPVSLVLEQQPDIERAWFNQDGSGILHGILAFASILVVAFGYWLIGRKRSVVFLREDVLGLGPLGYPREYTPATFLWRRWPGRLYILWFAIPVVVGIGGLIYAGFNPDLIDWKPFGIFIGISFGIPSLSLLIEWAWWRQSTGPAAATPPSPPPAAPLQTGLFVARAGDLLSSAMVSIAALGLVRALIPHLALAVAGRPTPDTLLGLYVVAVIVALATAVFFFVVGRDWIETTSYGSAPPAAVGPVARFLREFNPSYIPTTLNPIARTTMIVGIVLATGVLIGAIGVPRAFGAVIGVIAMVVLSLGAWSLMVALIILILRRRRPLALFELLGLRRDPIITLFIVVPILIGFIAPTFTVHEIDQTSSATPARPTLALAFIRWVNSTNKCTAIVDGQTVRPLVLIAAEGGGIRAATWTADVLAELRDDGDCTANSVFLSSGVSGGSVGLAVAATADTAAEMRENVVELSSSAALPTAVSGLVVSDPLASATGLRVSSWESPGIWRDRASLIEQSWRDAVPELDDAFSTSSHPTTGYVVLNSTDLRSGCRVSISQVRLDDRDDWSRETRRQYTLDGPACKQNTQEPALTVDLISAYRQCGVSYRGDWATSAMLSARFPYVTPSGGVDVGGVPGDDCPHTLLQLMDGGYAENSGLGLISDISSRLSALIRAENAKGGPPVVPYIMYIQNSPGGYVTESPRADTTQIIVPIAGQGTKAEQLAASSWIQRIMTNLDAGETPVISAAQRTVIVAISTEPAVNVPLGWGLSDATETRLLTDAQRQADADGCLRKTKTHVCLSDLLGLQDK